MDFKIALQVRWPQTKKEDQKKEKLFEQKKCSKLHVAPSSRIFIRSINTQNFKQCTQLEIII